MANEYQKLNQKIDGLAKKIDQFIKNQVTFNTETSKNIQEVYKNLRNIQDTDRMELEARIESRVFSKKDGKYHYYTYKSNIQYGKKVDYYFVINWSLNEVYKKKGEVEVEITDPHEKENLKYQIFQDFNKDNSTRFVESDDPENDVIKPYFYLKFKKDDMSDDDWGVQYDYYAKKISWHHSEKPLTCWVAIDWKNKKVYQYSEDQNAKRGWLTSEEAEVVMNSVSKPDLNMWIYVDRPEVYLKNYKVVYESYKNKDFKEQDDFDVYAFYQMSNNYAPNKYFILDKTKDVVYYFYVAPDGTSKFETSWLKKGNLSNDKEYVEISLEKIKNAKDLKNYLYKESKNHHIHIDGEINLKKDDYKFYKDLKVADFLNGRVFALNIKKDQSYEFDYLKDGTTYFAKAFPKAINFADKNNYREIQPCDIKDFNILDKELSYSEEDDNLCEADPEDEKINSDDLELLWRDHGFAALYDEAKYYAKFLEQYDVSDKDADDWKQYNEHNKWADSATNDKTIWSRLFTAIAFFDIDKIATQIARANNDATTNDYLITSADVDNLYSASEWEKCLYNCLKEVVEDFIEHGEANKNDTYKNYQRGRVHLDSILYHYEDEDENGDYPIIKLYWTDEESSAGDNF